MNILFALWIGLSSFGGGVDTLRTDGYYLKVSEQAESWHLIYFSPQGIYMDTIASGTPPVFEQGSLHPDPAKTYAITTTKNEFVLKTGHLNLPPFHVESSPVQYKYLFEKGDLVFTAWKGHKGKWKKIRERYFFIPY